MEQTIFDILNEGLSLSSILNLLMMGASIIVIIAAKQFAADFIAWRRFKTNLGIYIGSVIRLYNGDYVVEGKIIQANMRRIILETKNMFIMIPMADFRSRDWYVKKPNTSTDDLLSHSISCVEYPDKSCTDEYPSNITIKNKIETSPEE